MHSNGHALFFNEYNGFGQVLDDDDGSDSDKDSNSSSELSLTQTRSDFRTMKDGDRMKLVLDCDEKILEYGITFFNFFLPSDYSH